MEYWDWEFRTFALGVAIACTILLSACGGGGDGGGESPRAAVTAASGSTYRMGYQLDAAGRIKTYEMRDEASDRLVQSCSGDLHASWDCRVETPPPATSLAAAVDEQGRPKTFRWDAPWGQTIAYSYNADGRLSAVERSQANFGSVIETHTLLEYDAVGHLAGIRVSVDRARAQDTETTYTVISPSAVPTRLLMTTGFPVSGFPDTNFTIQLDHDGTGRYTKRTVNEVTGGEERVASTVSYVVDSHGYITGRVYEKYQYEPGVTPVLREETSWCLDWSPSAVAALASERSCPSSTFYYSIVYPGELMPSTPLTTFPAYSASSALDLLCVIADVCVDPQRLAPSPY